nr:hypothetical protein [Tanacetum cinerariifolium]
MFKVNRIEDRGTMHGVQVQLVMGELRTELEYFKDKMLLMQAQENGVALDEEQLLFIVCGQDNVGDDDVDEQPIQDLAINVDNMFQANKCDAFDSDVNEVPTAQTMFMANLLSVDPIYDEAGSSYDSKILSEVHDRDHYQDAACEHHEEYEMHDDVQPTYVVDSHADYTCDNDMIPYDQYVNDNAVPVVQNNVSFVPNDAYMMILNDMHEQPDQYIFGTIQNTVVNKSLTAELAIYKEQPALYNGHEISKTNHVPAIVHNSEETLEIAEITRKKINEKMNDLEYVKKKVKIAPHDYSKENHLATFAPQKQLTPEQIFWYKDLIKMKSKALKEQTTASRPMKALTVYPLNTPATLSPGCFQQSQVKINIFALIQLFLEFKKTCKKRITPTGLTERERGFEQTKECYLAEFISFFKTLKEHFKGVQKDLTKEIKEMKEIFEELKAKVDQNVMHRKHDVIEQKNLLIANYNLIADCLSKDVFYTATDYVLTMSRFSDMHEALNSAQKHIAKLESKNSNIKSVTSSDAPTFDSVFVIGQLKDQIQSRGNTIRELRDKISRLTMKHSEAVPTHDSTALDSQTKEIHAKINALHDLNERWRTETETIKRKYKELYAINMEPIPPRIRNNREAHLDYLKHLKESVETLREIVEEAKVERPLDKSLASACLYTKHS